MVLNNLKLKRHNRWAKGEYIMKRVKRLLVYVLFGVLVSNNLVYASEKNNDIYENNYSETVDIEGTTYIYHYNYDSDGNRVIRIENYNSNEVDVVKCSSETGEIFLNGDNISEGDTVNEINVKYSNTRTSSKYKLIGTRNKKVSWATSTSAAALAAVVAVAVTGISAAAVIAKIGAAALGVIALQVQYGVVKAKIYQMTAGSVTTYKYVWSFTPNGGSKYGDYTSYITV